MEHRLTTPLDRDKVLRLSAGDVVYLSGRIFTARDEAHRRMLAVLSRGERLPFDLSGGVVYHCGPLLRDNDTGWTVISAGPTTSERMAGMTPELLDRTDLSGIIGKGGMRGLADLFRSKGCVYLAYPGGCAALAAERISRVVGVHWLDLGMAEAVWEFEVDRFGPLIVGIDSQGEDLYERVLERSKRRYSPPR